ncbi:TPA: HNH endonuclease [Proteus mirabilis]
MNYYIYTWNPDKWKWLDRIEAICKVNNEEYYSHIWSSKNIKKIKKGDIFFLLQTGKKNRGIIGLGIIEGIAKNLPIWDSVRAKKGETEDKAILSFKVLSDIPILSREELLEKYPHPTNSEWNIQTIGQNVQDELAELLFKGIERKIGNITIDNTHVSDSKYYREGKPRTTTVTTYDRNSEAREACLAEYGYICSICNFDFYRHYGVLGKNFIEVHHLNQLADLAEEHEINPIEDLRPVCSNCHRMLHRKRPALSIKELQKIIENNISIV